MMIRAITSRLLVIILFVSLLMPAINTANPDNVFADTGETDIDIKKLESVIALTQTPNAEVVFVSNLLYTPGYSSYTEVGQEINRLHEEVAQLVIGKMEELTINYQEQFKLNDEFNTNTEEVFAIWQAYYNGSSQQSDNTVAAYYSEEEKLYQEYSAFKVMETLMRAKIDSLSGSLEKIKKDENVPANESLSQSECLLMLLGSYTQLAEVYTSKYTVLFSRALVLHSMEQEANGGLPRELVQQLQSTFNTEKELAARIIGSSLLTQSISEQIVRGLQGLKEFEHQVLKVSIDMIELQMPEYEDMVARIKNSPDRQDVAELCTTTLDVYKYLLTMLKDVETELDAQGKPDWLARAIEDSTNITYSKAPSRGLLIRPVYAEEESGLLRALGASLDGLRRCASAAKDGIVAGAGVIYETGGAAATGIVNAAEASLAFGKEFVTTSYEAGKDILAKGYDIGMEFVAPKKAPLAVLTTLDMGFQLAANEAIGLLWGHSLEDINTWNNQVFDLYLGELQQGKMGATTCRTIIGGFEWVEKGAGGLVEGGWEWAIGKGTISWLGGKVGSSIASIFTGLGKGYIQLLDPNASPGQLVEGGLNVGLCLIGGTGLGGNVAKWTSSTFGPLLSKIPGVSIATRYIGAAFTRILGRHAATMAGATDDAVKAVEGSSKGLQAIVDNLTDPLEKGVLNTMLGWFSPTNILNSTVDNELTALAKSATDWATGTQQKPSPPPATPPPTGHPLVTQGDTGTSTIPPTFPLTTDWVTGNGPYPVVIQFDETGNYNGWIYLQNTWVSTDIYNYTNAQSIDTIFTIPLISLDVYRDAGDGRFFNAGFDYRTTPHGFTPQTETYNSAGASDITVEQPGYTFFTVDELFSGTGGKAGGFKTPSSEEYNGTFQRLDYTITPSFLNYSQNDSQIQFSLPHYSQRTRWDLKRAEELATNWDFMPPPFWNEPLPPLVTPPPSEDRPKVERRLLWDDIPIPAQTPAGPPFEIVPLSPSFPFSPPTINDFWYIPTLTNPIGAEMGMPLFAGGNPLTDHEKKGDLEEQLRSWLDFITQAMSSTMGCPDSLKTAWITIDGKQIEIPIQGP